MGCDLIKIEIIHRRNPFNLFRLDRGQTSGNPTKLVWGVVTPHSLYKLRNCYQSPLHFIFKFKSDQITKI